MSTTDVPNQRVLAIDPFGHGIAFAVLEGVSALVDFGFRVTRQHKSQLGIERTRAIIRRYRPEVLVIEDAAVTCHRSKRVLCLVDRLERLGGSLGIKTVKVSWVMVYDVFGRCGAQTKQGIFTVVVRLYPHMIEWLPKRMVTWGNVDPHVHLFDAIALAITYLFQGSPEDSGASAQASTKPAKSTS